jgi:polyhydroxybutyrate depolymerase
MRMLRFILTRALMALMALVQPAQAERQSVALGERLYLIDLPDQPNGAAIIALHGGGGNPEQFAGSSGLFEAARAQGYAVIYPAGSGPQRRLIGRMIVGRLLTWNAGYCCGYAKAQGIDDVGFLDAVAADATSRFGLSRFYATGMSNGAMMAERFAAEGKTPLKAVAAVAGTMDLKTTPKPRPVPLLVIHGTADDHVAYGGGPGPNSWEKADFTAVTRIIAAWRQALGPLRETRSVIDPADDGMRVTRTDYARPDGSIPLRLLTVEGGGHTWPGGRRAPRQKGTQDIRANDELLAFFALWP